AYVQHPVLAGSHYLQISTRFNFNPPLVRLENLRPRELFASLHRSYVRDGVGTVKLRSLSDRTVDARIFVAVPGASDAPSETTIVVRPHAMIEASLPAVFSPKIMQRTSDLSTQVVVTARCARRTEHASSTTHVYALGTIDWAGGVEQAAAFVTPRE